MKQIAGQACKASLWKKACPLL